MAVIREKVQYEVTDLNSEYYLLVEALNGTTQNSGFFDANEKLVLLTNQSTIGYLGKGNQLKGKNFIIVKSNLENNTPNVYSTEDDQITARYIIKSPTGNELIFEYDKPEKDDDYPTIKLIIEFV